MTSGPTDATTRDAPTRGLSLAPFRALRPDVDDVRLGRLLSPPYDVIDAATRRRLLDGDPDNVVAVVLPDPTPTGYAEASELLRRWVKSGLFAVDDAPALYVYEMNDGNGSVTRGLMGAVELRDPDDGVILPHENTMAGPVADRLAVMTATDADLEPIYLVYDGGGAASQVVRDVDPSRSTAEATTPDGLVHRLWTVTDPAVHEAVAADLGTRRALIADGHHRYATYRERQRLRRDIDGPGPWDRGLALLVDSSAYGPQVHAIHRVINGLPLHEALERLRGSTTIEDRHDTDPQSVLAAADSAPGFAVVLTDGDRTVLVTDPDGTLAAAAIRADEPAALADLDVTVVHRGLVERTLGLRDDVDSVGYAHSVTEAIEAGRAAGGFALLLRPTPVAAVAAVAAHGARMPRKSTLFTPKPASGLVMRSLSVLP
ncbi:MAG TPA: DUF1015 domain-containing protein [Jatrophihabitans sp.]|jgi:uncharacterized protein (DUF1015 family)|uniref:DUF1015 domain-containing protein n=1 Tax=Jatrophihabitans sp. TaxID=1932789 RepID=UPI002DF77248|nr:DUF1015 domain-containing protein [Jatrophihabitans sp.]